MSKMKRLFSVWMVLLLAGCQPLTFQNGSYSSNSPANPQQKEPWPAPQKSSVLQLLKTALQPVGKTMYIWGGGWNEEDTGGGIESVTLGVSDTWAEFAAQQDYTYDFYDHLYEIHNGLDCSGYIGWLVYNTLEDQDGQPSYVLESNDQTFLLQSRGLGRVIPYEDITTIKPGDIFNSSGHIYLLVYPFEDGSRLIVHSSPPGVRFAGTPDVQQNPDSQAARWAARIMAAYYPDFYARYPDVTTSADYNYFDQFVWSPNILRSTSTIAKIKPEELIYNLFGSVPPDIFAADPQAGYEELDEVYGEEASEDLETGE